MIMHVRQFWDKIGSIATLSVVFLIPISTAGVNVSLGIVVLSWFVGGNLREKAFLFFRHPLAKWIIIWVVFGLLGVFYTIADWPDVWGRLKDILRFLYIPFLMFYLVGDRKLSTVAWVFSFAMIITLILAYLKVYGGLPIGLKYTAAAVFKSHIKTNFFMSIAAFHLALKAKEHASLRKYLVPLIGVMIYYILFMSIGRIGYLTLIGFSIVFIMHFYAKNRLLALGLSIVFVGIGLSFSYLFSNHFSDRIDALGRDWQYYQEGNRLVESSLGSRVTFDLYSMELLKENLIWGLGTGSFKLAYKQLAEYKGDDFLTDNPHNEYLRVGVEFGSIGILLLLSLFFRQWRCIEELPSKEAIFLKGFFLMFFIGCFVNSWLIDFTEGSLYGIMSATLLAQSSCNRRIECVQNGSEKVLLG